MHKDFVSPVSVEEFAAYLDGNLPQEEMHRVSSIVSVDDALHDIATNSLSIDEALLNGGSTLKLVPEVLNSLDFEIPNLDESGLVNNYSMNLNYGNMAEHINYGYEPNNELDTFDANIWQGNQPTCAIRSQEIILRDYGIYHSQDDLVKFATENGWFSSDPQNGGTDKYAVGNILDACGIPTTRTDNATIYDIISELKAGHRVIVSVDADELWVKKEPNLFKRIVNQITNKANDTVQEFLGLEGANHALIVAGVNVNPKDPSDIKVTLIDSGTGDVCVEYSFKNFQDAWNDGHCRMISTDIPAPFQYNYHTHQVEPSNIATSYVPSMAQMPDGLTNQFSLSESYYDEYKEFTPEYNDETNPMELDDTNGTVLDCGFDTGDAISENRNHIIDDLLTDEYISDDVTDEGMSENMDSLPITDDKESTFTEDDVNSLSNGSEDEMNADM